MSEIDKQLRSNSSTRTAKVASNVVSVRSVDLGWFQCLHTMFNFQIRSHFHNRTVKVLNTPLPLLLSRNYISVWKTSFGLSFPSYDNTKNKNVFLQKYHPSTCTCYLTCDECSRTKFLRCNSESSLKISILPVRVITYCT